MEEGERQYIKSHIHQHLTADHPEVTDVRGAFGTRVVNPHKTAFNRQLDEVILQRHLKGKLRNNKLDYNACTIPELSTDNNREQIIHNRKKRANIHMIKDSENK